MKHNTNNVWSWNITDMLQIKKAALPGNGDDLPELVDNVVG